MNLEKPVVGQTFYVVDVGNNARYGGGNQRYGEVVKVGRKYFDVEFGDSYKYSITFNIDGRLQKTEYCQNYELHDSEQAYLDNIRRVKLYAKMKDTFESYDTKKCISLSDLIDIANILDVAVDD